MVAPLVGTLLLVGGVLAGLFARRVAPVLRQLQTRVYGKRFGEKTNAQLTPSYVRFISIVFAACGMLFLLLTALGAFTKTAS